ncbi:hypothetical protein RM549_12300 [Salegentibacter sp. F188]|uniref:Hydrolase n=1 Tax=Autumnicola patrickiae TaxID=3075591 RepID=A0ABU3E3R3_9FLAO|nr:hypothetical protein [Salegentibacter sp. F188]MDT0690572.1 hypothetical protein [Salegentibacter sp. F188]
MRSKILMYLFIFTLLFTIFIYVNDKKILDARDESIAGLERQVTLVKEELDSLKKTNIEPDYFSIDRNEDALNFFEEREISTEDVKARIQDKLISGNSATEDNPFVPFAGMEGPMRINKIKIVNHKWVLADFTDGTYWGEVFFTYSVEEDGEVNLVPEKSFLYPLD